MLQIKQKKRTKLRFALIIALTGAIVMSGCTVKPRTAPLEASATENEGYRYKLIKEDVMKDNTLIAATFSGGGMRAAALAYGALMALKETKKSESGIKSRLIDEVDLVSAVSGGSVTAAYWALKGSEGLKDLKAEFLHECVQGELIKTAINPATWLTLAMPSYSRIDIFRDYLEANLFEANSSVNCPSNMDRSWDYVYDTEAFEGATYQNLMDKNGPTRPYLIINTTDMATGKVFSFTQDMFDFLCADLTKFKLADAVAASTAYPVALTALTVKNHWSDQKCQVTSLSLRELIKVLTEAEQDVKTKKKDLSKVEQEITTTKDDLEKARERKQSLELDVARAKGQVETKKQALADAKKEAITKQRDLLEAEQDVKTKKKDLLEVEQEITTTKDDLEKARERKQSLELDVARAEGQVETKKQALTDAKKEAITKQRDLLEAEQDVKTKKKDLLEVEQEITTTKDDLEKARERKQSLELDVARAKGQVNLLKLQTTLKGALSAQSHDYHDKGTQYVHFLDGGVADNVGLTPLLGLLDSIFDSEEKKMNPPKRIVVIAVNARSNPANDYGKRDTPPNAFQTLVTTIGAAIDSTSFVLNDQLERMEEKAFQKSESVLESDPKSKIFRVIVSLDSIEDEKCRRRLQNIPTSWSLETEQVENLIKVGRELVFNSEDYKKFVGQLDFETPNNTATGVCSKPMGIP